MASKDDPRPAEPRPQKRRVERRAVLRGLATGFAGAVAAPHASSFAGVTPGSSQQKPGIPGVETPSARLLDENDLEVLGNLSELLVPGSVAAGVPELVDRVAAVDTLEAQRKLLSALRAFEGEARTAHASRWVALDRDTQVGILEAASSGTHATLQEPFAYLRDVVARTYFTTEPGMRRLGWTGRSAWRELPACEHASDDHR